MRIKFLSPIVGNNDFKTKFCDMIDQLPFNIDDYILSGVNLYFNIHDKETGQQLTYVQNGIEANFLKYGFANKKQIKEKTKAEKPKKVKQQKSGKVLQFNPQ